MDDMHDVPFHTELHENSSILSKVIIDDSLDYDSHLSTAAHVRVHPLTSHSNQLS